MIREINDITLVNQQLIDLIALAINPSKANIALINAIQNNNEVCYTIEKNNKFLGVITIREKDGICKITSIAVDMKCQKEGYGKQLIDYIKRDFKKIIAETDDEAVNFYRKQGFKIITLGEKYPGVIRYQCIFLP
ncbi:GNAT family N-acetyltransferase [Macrococcus capreoli]|uniref:GNAT family N-acetyltransferase n=1 Tax=Macrococcus capreoli TaxID=2982690 RepID=UPI0021D5B913|nr:GNAT family N-acetyltransferase [Macrococcus sp. TMW 2.2395]MCU7557985.1 GNAT family N-acetyltransferase [Macrococcus sp. TMW 2.2395]